MKQFVILFLFAAAISANAQQPGEKGVRFVRDDSRQKIEIYVDGKLFTVYNYSPTREKPFMYPVYAPDGSVVTRGFPIEPRKGERVDHPHQVGLWFNYGNVNGLDFWNNSQAIPADKKDGYGHIVARKIVKAEDGKQGTLEVISDWDDNKGDRILREDAKYIISGDRSSRTIDHVTTLTAVDGPVKFADNKEGMFAIRVDRSLEMPSEESLIFTDDKGNPTTVPATNNTGVTGMYFSSSGKKGDSVWGTRNKWVCLSGIKDNVPVTLAIFDHPENPGFPAYFHARGYGLFSVNNFGQNSYDPKQQKKDFNLAKGQSVTLRHRFFVIAGSEMTPDMADKIFKDFSLKYVSIR